jgi:hypothetical protein
MQLLGAVKKRMSSQFPQNTRIFLNTLNSISLSKTRFHVPLKYIAHCDEFSACKPRALECKEKYFVA